jgi:hypothetical protein
LHFKNIPRSAVNPAIGETLLASIAETEKYTRTISWSSGTALAAVNVSYTTNIVITPKKEITLTGYSISGITDDAEVSTSTDATLAITTAFPVWVNSPTDLPVAIAAAKNSNSPLILLTNDFYTTANILNNYIVVGQGISPNVTPYTIRVIGKDALTLNIRILLANDYVTLEEVNVAAITNNTGIPTSWVNGSSYRLALVIARLDDNGTLITRTGAGSQHVTVQNCTITSTESGSNAVQGITIQHWDPTIKITNNIITTRYGT